jgi:tetratricopeptide (TPR) repeat protein
VAPPDAPLPADHPRLTEGKAPPTAEQLLQQLDATPGLKEREKTFEMAGMIGRLYLHNGRPQDARAFLAQAEQKASGLRALLLAEEKRLAAPARAGVEKAVAEGKACPGLAEDALFEAREAEARARLAKGDRAGAVGCARMALLPLLDVLAQAGTAAQLAGDVPGALAAHDRALALDPAAPESLFARAALLYETRGQDRQALTRARDALKLLLARHPAGARAPQASMLLTELEDALKAGGVSQRDALRARERQARVAKDFPTTAPPAGAAMAQAGARPGAQAGTPGAAAGGPMAAGQGGQGSAPVLSKEMVDAVQSVERTPEFEAGLDKALAEGEEHLARGRYQEALASYRQVMPFRPQDGRTQAGLAWSLQALNRQPMADRVWGVAVQSAPNAVEALGDTLKAKGAEKEARAVWSKLSQSAPGYRGALAGKLE